MRITFFIEYHTRWGQQLLLCGDAESLGSNREEHALPMQYVDDGWWIATVDIDPNRTFTYRYLLREDGVISRKEWGGEHCFRRGHRAYSSEGTCGPDRVNVFKALETPY